MWKRSKKSSFKVKINLTPTKKKKKPRECNCILQCKRDKDEIVTKFSKTSRSRDVIYKTAQLRSDNNMLSILDPFGENLPASEYGYHRKCYQNYTHKRLLEKLSAEVNEPVGSSLLESSAETAHVRASSRNRSRGGKIIIVQYQL